MSERVTGGKAARCRPLAQIGANARSQLRRARGAALRAECLGGRTGFRELTQLLVEPLGLS